MQLCAIKSTEAFHRVRTKCSELVENLRKINTTFQGVFTKELENQQQLDLILHLVAAGWCISIVSAYNV